jgi:hypothetical protein
MSVKPFDVYKNSTGVLNNQVIFTMHHSFVCLFGGV